METKPNKWFAGVVGFLLPPLGMLYSRLPWFALLFLLFQVAIAIVFGTPFVINLPQRWGLPAALCFNILSAVFAFQFAAAAEPSRKRWYSRWYGLIGVGAGFFVCIFFVRAFLYEPFRVPSDSMYPTIPEGSLLIVAKRDFGHYSTYGIRFFETTAQPTLHRCDVVIHRLPDDPNTYYVRTIIGLPGDSIVYTGARMTINGVAVPTTVDRVEGPMQYATEVIDGRSISIALAGDHRATPYSGVVPPDHYLMFGNNRNNALDSRFKGPIATNLIGGRVVKVFTPRKK